MRQHAGAARDPEPNRSVDPSGESPRRGLQRVCGLLTRSAESSPRNSPVAIHMTGPAHYLPGNQLDCPDSAPEQRPVTDHRLPTSIRSWPWTVACPASGGPQRPIPPPIAARTAGSHRRIAGSVRWSAVSERSKMRPMRWSLETTPSPWPRFQASPTCSPMHARLGEDGILTTARPIYGASLNTPRSASSL